MTSSRLFLAVASFCSLLPSTSAHTPPTTLTFISGGPSTSSRITPSTQRNMKTQSNEPNQSTKKIVLIRHGCTHMNEYLSKPGSQWGDANFTDIFEQHVLDLYRDSPLSKDGIQQATSLCETLSTCSESRDVLKNVEIVVSSPLTRTLQTTELALWPHLQTLEKGRREQVPVVALPLATERLYLISDHGSSTVELRKRFPFVDFESEHGDETDEWWFQVVSDEDMEKSSGWESFRYVQKRNYVEWRPNENGQTYACHGEPDFHFRSRMVALSNWLSNRKESTICLVAHWGVLEWLTGGDDFKNCEMKVVDFDKIRRR